MGGTAASYPCGLGPPLTACQRVVRKRAALSGSISRPGADGHGGSGGGSARAAWRREEGSERDGGGSSPRVGMGQSPRGQGMRPGFAFPAARPAGSCCHTWRNEARERSGQSGFGEEEEEGEAKPAGSTRAPRVHGGVGRAAALPGWMFPSCCQPQDHVAWLSPRKPWKALSQKHHECPTAMRHKHTVSLCFSSKQPALCEASAPEEKMLPAVRRQAWWPTN